MSCTFLIIIWELFVNSFEVFLFLWLVTNKLTRKKSQTTFLLISFIFFTLLTSFLNFYQVPSTISLIILFLSKILYTIFYFNNTISKKIFWGGVFTFIILFSDKFTLWIASVFTSYHLSELLIGGVARIPMTLFYLFTCFCLVFLFTKMHNKQFYLPQNFRIVLLLLSIANIFISNSLLGLIIDIDSGKISKNISQMLNTINFLFLFIFFSMLFLIKWIGSIYQKNLELLEENQQVNVEKQQFEVFAETTQALREWKHDYKNTLSVLSMMLANEQLDKANSYLLELLATEPAPAFQISSGNSVLDAIVSTKLSIAKNQGIDFQHAIFLPKIIPFSPLDFSTIMGNLLDNAIKACEDVLADTSINLKPYVMLEIKPQMDMLYIRISNSSCGRYCYDTQGNLMSSKKEPGHGIGIKRIIKMVHKYDGIYQQEAESNHFTLTIMVPLLNYEETSL